MRSSSPSLPETSELQALVASVDGGSLSAASRSLGVPRATLSRRLQRLEETLNVRLLHRSTRALRLTEAGESYYQHARQVLTGLEEATRALQPQNDIPRGRLRISVPPMGHLAFRTMLLDFDAAYPEVQLEVISTTSHQDLKEGNIDVAWRAGADLPPDLVARRLATFPRTAVAATTYLQKHGRPKRVRDLRQHACLLGFVRGQRPQTHWPLRNGEQVRVHAALSSNDLQLLVDAVYRGTGIALLPEIAVARGLWEGTIERVLPRALGSDDRLSLLYTERRFMRPAVRAFLDHVVAWWKQAATAKELQDAFE